MMNAISLLNGTAVTIFGCILAASFSGALSCGRQKKQVAVGCVIILLLQAVTFGMWDFETVRMIYPVLIHFPLFLLLCLITKKVVISLVSVMTAYVCCQLRRWFALVIVAVLPVGEAAQDIVELCLTVPLVIYILLRVSPAVRKLEGYSVKRQWQFAVVPILYYLFDYLAIVYTDLYYQASPVALEFIPFICCASYLGFLGYNAAEEKKYMEQQLIKDYLDVQLGRSVRELQELREIQELTKQHRHDMRHHLQYLSACIENGQYDTAQKYIGDICNQVEALSVKRYCENEEVNLILSSFAGRAQKDGIRLDVRCVLPEIVSVSDSDLCVMLSNALENAVHSCNRAAENGNGQKQQISVQLFEREKKLFLEVVNPCATDVAFENGVPVSKEPGHGIGVQSICAIVDKYHGIYSFQVQEGQFILRLSL